MLAMHRDVAVSACISPLNWRSEVLGGVYFLMHPLQALVRSGPSIAGPWVVSALRRRDDPAGEYAHVRHAWRTLGLSPA